MDSDSRRRRLRAAGTGALVIALAALLGACGGSEDPQGADEKAGKYPVRVVDAQFPSRQKLAQTSLLRLGLRNAGEEKIPSLVVSVGVGGVDGERSVQPFSIRDPQPDLSLPYRPIWVLEEGWPKTVGTPPGSVSNVETSDQRTFDFGSLDAGEAIEAVWRVTAVRAGDFDLRYKVEAGLGGEARAVSPGGGPVRGAFPVQISAEPPETRVNDRGEVVIIRP